MNARPDLREIAPDALKTVYGLEQYILIKRGLIQT